MEEGRGLPIGAVAPDFDLPVTLGGQTVRLSDYKGKKTVVILFSP